jgi:hypothetical protein
MQPLWGLQFKQPTETRQWWMWSTLTMFRAAGDLGGISRRCGVSGVAGGVSARAGFEGTTALLMVREEEKRNHGVIRKLLSDGGNNYIFTTVGMPASGAMGPSMIAFLQIVYEEGGQQVRDVAAVGAKLNVEHHGRVFVLGHAP